MLTCVKVLNNVVFYWCQRDDQKINVRSFKTIAIDSPGGNLSLAKNIKAQTTALNRAITY